MSITQLTAQNFYLGGRHNKTLNINIPGFVLVFFKMQNCTGCNAFEPIFYQLAQNERRINYAICDVSIHQNIPMLSKQTSAPIQAVPWLMFYSDETPIARFRGKKNIPSLKAFISKAIQESQKRKTVRQQTFMPPQQAPVQGNYPGAHPGMPQGGHPQNMVSRGEQPAYYKPEIGKATGTSTKYALLGTSEEDENEETSALVPENIIPNNKPWETMYRKLNSFN